MISLFFILTCLLAADGFINYATLRRQRQQQQQDKEDGIIGEKERFVFVRNSDGLLQRISANDVRQAEIRHAAEKMRDQYKWKVPLLG